MNEFEPELRQIRLDRIRVDRISGKDNDRNKVERVRVNSEDDKAKMITAMCTVLIFPRKRNGKQA